MRRNDSTVALAIKTVGFGAIGSFVAWAFTNSLTGALLTLSVIFVVYTIIQIVPRVRDKLVIPLTRSGIAKIHKSHEAATEAIGSLVGSAREIDVCAVRGLGIASLEGSVIRKNLRNNSNRIRIRVVYLSDRSKYCADRASEIGENLDEFRSALRVGYAGLSTFSDTTRYDFDFRVYDEQPVWRIIRIDDTVFVSGFEAGIHAHECAIYEIKRYGKHSLYGTISRQFEALFARSRPRKHEL